MAPVLQEAPLDDATLVERIARGDQRAFATLYRRHAAYLARLAHRILADAHEVDDVIQESFVAAARSLDRLRDPTQFRSWLATITVRSARRKLGQTLRRRALGDDLRDAEPHRSAPSQREDVETLYRALDQMSPKLRIPWVLHKIEGATLPETAQLCETSLTTVKRRIADADRRLRRKFDAR